MFCPGLNPWSKHNRRTAGRTGGATVQMGSQKAGLGPSYTYLGCVMLSWVHSNSVGFSEIQLDILKSFLKPLRSPYEAHFEALSEAHFKARSKPISKFFLKYFSKPL